MVTSGEGRLALAREHRITQTPQNDRVVPSEERQLPEITA
jgi:3-hydroxybutyryl-CoA dehydratase